MNNRLAYSLALALIVVFAGCSTPSEPQIIPPQPQFADSTMPPNPVDHRIYADVDGQRDAIMIEWKPDPTNNTSGYILYRSADSITGSDGVLLHAQILAQFENSNSLGEPLPTSYQDTTGILPGGEYWYQLRAFYRSPTNAVTYSAPTKVDLTTSFRYANRVSQDVPAGSDSLHLYPGGLPFRWDDPDHGSNGGRYQLIVQRTDNQQYVVSIDYLASSSPITENYPSTAPPLLPGTEYRWRVKTLFAYGGSTSPWLTFTVKP